jgi:hypothetical protein
VPTAATRGAEPILPLFPIDSLPLQAFVDGLYQYVDPYAQRQDYFGTYLGVFVSSARGRDHFTRLCDDLGRYIVELLDWFGS